MMTAWNKAGLLLRGILLPVLLLVATASSRADAQDVNVANLTDALSKVAQLGKDVRAMRAVASIPLGPYELATQCTWCSKDFIGICLEHTTETWRTNVDFTWTRNHLNQVLAQMQQNADAFPVAFAPVQAWIDSLPAFSARFNQAADIVLDVQQQIKAGKGPDDGQRQAVTKALESLIGDLTANSRQLEDGTRALAAALQQQSAFGPQIKQAIDGADEAARSSLANLQTVASTHRCQDGLPEKFSAIKAGFSNSIGSISAEFQTLEASRQASDRGLALLLGTLVSSRTDVQSVMEQIKAANNDALGSFLARLHLASAKAQWQQITDYAMSHLSHGAG